MTTFLQLPFWSRDYSRMWQHIAVARVQGDSPDEPISVDDAKDFLRVTVADEDVLIGSMITAARQFVEQWIGRPLQVQQWDVFLDRRPRDGTAIALPFAPLVWVDSIKTTDLAGVEHTVDPTTYAWDTASEPGRVWLLTGQMWPVDLRAFQPIVIRIRVGYAVVPETIIQAMRLLIGHYFENRVASAVGVRFDATLPFGVAELLAPYTVVGVA
jgi:uncharacterized phiE125 gp8 family phage protein